mgnify:CR=1 FL=1
MNIINLPVTSKEEEKAKRKADLLEVIDFVRKLAEAGEITEFVGATIDKDGDVTVHVSTFDLPGAIGLFEIGKHIIISQET